MNNNQLKLNLPIWRGWQTDDNRPGDLADQTEAKVTYVREVRLNYRGPKRLANLDAIHEPEKAAAFMRRVLPDNVREHFLTLFLNGANCVVGYFVAATGTANFCHVGAREVFQAAVVGGAVSIIVGHNHPSGQAEPSPADADLTKRLSEAGALLGIHVLDHLVLGSEGYFSFRERGRMQT